jgi:hypothetical protein
MPALVAEFQKQALKTQFKKVYSVYAQNLQKTVMVDFDGNTDCWYRAEGAGNTYAGCVEFYERFVENLKVIKTCNGNALAGGCVPEYTYTPASGCPGYRVTTVNTLSTAYVLTDGSILVPYYTTGSPGATFLFDINGLKGPNRPGFDVFSLNFGRTNTGAYKLIGDGLDTNSIINCFKSTVDSSAPFKTFDDVFN